WPSTSDATHRYRPSFPTRRSSDLIVPVLAQMFPEHEAAQLEAWTQRFATLFLRSIYKWVQSPLSLHVGNLDLERERAMQLPVVRSEEHTSELQSRDSLVYRLLLQQ